MDFALFLRLTVKIGHFSKAWKFFVSSSPTWHVSRNREAIADSRQLKVRNQGRRKMLKRFIVGKNQRAALLRHGNFERILNPGPHYFFDPFNALSLTLWQTDTPQSEADALACAQRSSDLPQVTARSARHQAAEKRAFRAVDRKFCGQPAATRNFGGQA